jgi:hypothetical protein
VNRNLLFAPTELGFYISLNDGGSWSRFMTDLPVGRTDEVMVHPREHDLILATHSHSVWIMDDISALEQITQPARRRTRPVQAARRRAVEGRPNERDRSARRQSGGKAKSAPPARRSRTTSRAAATQAKVTIRNTATGRAVRSCNGTSARGRESLPVGRLWTDPTGRRWPGRRRWTGRRRWRRLGRRPDPRA